MLEDTSATWAVVADDNPAILLHAEAVLEDAGFRTLIAATGEEALINLEAHGEQIVLLFTDVQMPPGKVDGFELARRTAARWPAIGILVASGERFPEKNDLPAGAHFVAKPFSAEVVHERLHELLPEGRNPAGLLGNK